MLDRAHLAAIARSEPVRWTHLQEILTTPAHYLASFAEKEDTRIQRIGRVVDAYVLGGRDPVIFDGKRQGEKWERFARYHAGEEIVTVAENDAARFTADAIEANRDAMEVLRGRFVHPEINWKRGRRHCLSHPDVVADAFITELKIAQTAHPAMFIAHARQLRYPVQLVMYEEAARFVGMVSRPIDLFIVAAEYASPYAVTVFRLSAEMIASARQQLDEAFALMERCEASDRWPEYAEGVVDFN